MAQPDYVPVNTADKVRQPLRLPPAGSWITDRPGEIHGLHQPEGLGFGTAGPDQGYALMLAKRFASRLQLEAGESVDDAIAGCLGVALRRAASYGRAPVIFDLELAFTSFGFLGGAPAELVEWRKDMFASAGHDYDARREIADLVPEETLRLTPAQVRERLADWESLLSL